MASWLCLSGCLGLKNQTELTWSKTLKINRGNRGTVNNKANM